MRSKIADWDARSMIRLCQWRRKNAIGFFKAVTYTGYGRFWWTVAGLFMLLGNAGIQVVPFQLKLLQAMLGALVAYLLCLLMKRGFQRRRPFQVLADCPALISCTQNDSFPSAHAASWFAFSFATFLLQMPGAFAFGIWALLVSFSRFFLGVHFPSDLFAGAMVGILSGMSVLWLGL